MRAPELPIVYTRRRHGAEALRAAVRSGALVRVRSGAYSRPVTTDLPWEAQRERTLAACVAVAEKLTCRFAFSHRTAATLFDWPVPLGPDRIEITQEENPSRHTDDDIRRHRTEAFADGSVPVVDVAGLPVIAPYRTVLDCLRSLSAVDALALADGALADLASMSPFDRGPSHARQEICRDGLRALLAAVGPGRGVARARAVLDHADGFSGSPGESRTRWLALTAGLPAPVCQWEVAVDGQRFFADLAWPAASGDWAHRALALEYDGREKYGVEASDAVAVVLDEKAREDAIRSTDVRIHRVTAARVRAADAARRWLVGLFPPSTRRALQPRPELVWPAL